MKIGKYSKVCVSCFPIGLVLDELSFLRMNFSVKSIIFQVAEKC